MKFTSFLISLCVLLSVPSCTKDSDDDPTAAPGEIRCRIDGEARVFFGTKAIELRQNGGAQYFFIISGTADGDEFTITVKEDGIIATGDYSAEGEGPTQGRKATLRFVDNPGNNQYGSNPATVGSARVTITAITPTFVKGTFLGSVALNSNFSGGAVKMINGSFEAGR